MISQPSFSACAYGSDDGAMLPVTCGCWNSKNAGLRTIMFCSGYRKASCCLSQTSGDGGGAEVPRLSERGVLSRTWPNTHQKVRTANGENTLEALVFRGLQVSTLLGVFNGAGGFSPDMSVISFQWNLTLFVLSAAAGCPG